MKDILEDLRKMVEDDNSLDLTQDQILEILSQSVDFDYYVEDIQQNDVSIENSTFNTGQPIIKIRPIELMICTATDFMESLVDCGREYLLGKIDDSLEDFFDRDAFYKSCQEDKWLRDTVLEYNDVSKWEEVTYNGTDYVICE